MDLNEIAVFIKVVQTGSFSRAAKQLGMPNSTVSHRVSALEKRLGITLIQRTTRQLNVTPAGHSYFKRCMSGLEAIHAAEMEVAAIQGEPQGLLRITAPLELGSSILPDLLSGYSAQYPKVRLEVLLTDRRMDLLSESVDLAIRAGEMKDSTLIAKRIGSVYFAPVASSKYLKAHGSPSHPREIRHHRCIQFSPLGLEEWKLQGPKGAFNALLTSWIVVNDLNVVKRLAMGGEGIAMLPTHFVYPEINAGKLIRVLPEWRSNLSPVHFVYPAQRFVTPKLSAFIEFASEALRRTFEDFEI